jgi:hypothetical protein
MDLFNDEHYEDPRPEEDEEDEEDEEGEEGEEGENDGDDGEEDIHGLSVDKRKGRLISAISIMGAGHKQVNGIYEREAEGESNGHSHDEVAHYKKSMEKTRLYTTAPADGEFVIKRFRINGTR